MHSFIEMPRQKLSGQFTYTNQEKDLLNAEHKIIKQLWHISSLNICISIGIARNSKAWAQYKHTNIIMFRTSASQI